jgi:hypothetical protein
MLKLTDSQTALTTLRELILGTYPLSLSPETTQSNIMLSGSLKQSQL